TEKKWELNRKGWARLKETIDIVISEQK
ncbi:MAG: hypothetical protein JWQ09_5425, partial [Segetibacter sp.]|nr:hypothetical protein [Segetibacter sp.]